MSEVKFCLGQELKENIEIRRSLMGIKFHAKKSNPFKSLTLINQIKELQNKNLNFSSKLRGLQYHALLFCDMQINRW